MTETVQQQQQQTQQQARGAPWARAMPTGFLARRKAAMRENITHNGRRIIATQGWLIVASTFLAFFCWTAYWGESDDCASSPVGLKSWFLGSFVIYCVLIGFFLLTMYSVLSVMDNRLTRARIIMRSESAAADDDAEAEDTVFLDCAVWGTALVVLIVVLVLIWGIIGIAAAADAESDERAESCSYGRRYAGALVALTIFTACCCSAGNVADAHVTRTRTASAAAAAAPSVAAPAEAEAATLEV